jgi:ribonuclease E
MGNKMLIDATHPEETRVVVTRGNRVEEFDYESASRQQLRGNIYLAKVARIEPSLQAAFVNYGGNRHGFLAFAEIHPDYYQIPLAVREALMKEDALDRQNRSQENGEGASSGDSEGNASDKSSDTGDGVGSFVSSASQASETEASDLAAAANAGSPSTTSIEPQGKIGGETNSDREQGATPRESPIPLEAALPPIIYEEFVAAVARAEEARDEIPAHPDDIEGDEPEAIAIVSAGDVETVADSEGQSSSRGERQGEGERGNWQARSSSSSEGGVISVPEAATPAPVEIVGSEDALEELPQRHKRRWRHYKIQEVIKRNQIVLIQVVKEERGTKGAALTTYLSLAGRYTVLMPNTASGGGISRKITVPADRKRLKEIAQELEVPEGMGLIIRTAGASRTKAEIKRDFEYLLRLWENVRDLTLKSTAPCLVYEEGDLIKRSIRDLYNKDIDEILVAGEEAHREAKEFMRMLMPSHAKNVQLYKEPEPLFIKYEVERQLNQMFSPVVTLRSGGYIVLNQTEALVAIDVNSGRATREYSIEDTALKTNLEASEEVARQVRLRDLAGLIVIDYIDMDERRNNRAVERKLKEALRHDRARIQVGHISHFGLMEMSRQRLRQGVVEVSTMPCPVCQGVGHIRSTESVALMILRSIEDHLRTQGPANITTSTSPEAALYILNHKRAYLHDIEARYRVTIVIQADDKAHGGHFTLERGAEAIPPVMPETKAVQMEPVHAPAHVNGGGDEEEEIVVAAEGEDQRPQRRKRRRRRGGRGDQPSEQSFQNGAAPDADFDDQDDGEGEPEVTEATVAAAVSAVQPAVQGETVAPSVAESERESQFRRSRRRGRRGGRRHRDDAPGGSEFSQPKMDAHVPGLGEQPMIDYNHDFPKNLALGPIAPKQPAPEAVPVSQHEIAASTQGEVIESQAPAPVQPVSPQPSPAVETIEIQPQQTEPAQSPDVQVELEVTVVTPLVQEPKPKPVRTGPPRKGWWQRSIG